MLLERIKYAFRRDAVEGYFSTLLYSLHIIFHPADGFWDMNREHRASMSAANTIFALTILVNIWKIQLTSFLFLPVKMDEVNMLIEVLGVVLPLIVFCIANWSFTTLLDGKGNFRDIYMAMCYALTPYVLIEIPMMFVSNIITVEEGAFYQLLEVIAFVWCGALIFMGMMMIHDYSFLKTLASCIVTIIGIGVILFLLILFFSMTTDCIGYFVSLAKEIIFRLY